MERGRWMDATHSGRSVYAVSGYLWGAGTIRRGGDGGQDYISYKLDAETRENASQWHDRISALRSELGLLNFGTRNRPI